MDVCVCVMCAFYESNVRRNQKRKYGGRETRFFLFRFIGVGSEVIKLILRYFYGNGS